MKLEVLRVWLENSGEVDTLVTIKGQPHKVYDAIKAQGLRGWLNDQILDGANPIDLYIKTAQYIESCIPVKAQVAVWDVFWDLLNRYEHNDQTENEEA